MSFGMFRVYKVTEQKGVRVKAKVALSISSELVATGGGRGRQLIAAVRGC